MATDRLTNQMEQNTGNFELEDLELYPQTLKLLQNKIEIPEDPTKEDLTRVVSHYAQILAPERAHEPYAYSWIINAAVNNLREFSYLVTTQEGQKFMDDYVYLHQMAVTMYAHFNEHLGGNAFMVWGGNSFINQFPNKHHQEFIQQLLNSPKIDELDYGVRMHGGVIDSSFRVAAKEYLINLGQVQETLSPSGVAAARMAAAYGAFTSGGMFLEKISPDGVTEREPVKPIAKIYRENKDTVRETLYSASKTLANPGIVLEMLEDHLNSIDKWYFDTCGAIQLVGLIRTITGDLYPQFQQVIVTKINQLKLQGSSIPQNLADAVNQI